MHTLTEKINSHLEILALGVVTLDKDDIPGMGQLLNATCSLEADCKEMNTPVFVSVTQAVKAYIERLILGDAKDITPLEKGISCLQSIFQAFSRNEEFKQNVSLLLKTLDADGSQVEGEGSLSGSQPEKACMPGKEGTYPTKNLDDEDRQILSEFVTESLENLADIEINLIRLEERPDDLEIINDIFRPFHTIKGISSYLKLDKINRLSHSSESLLDKARDGEIKIDETMIDIILESVDTLKRMIFGIRDGLENEVSLDNGTNITSLIARIDELNRKSERVADKPLGEIMVQKGVLDQAMMGDILAEQKRDPDKKFGEILLAKGAAGSKDVISALREQRKFGRKDIDVQVRVDTKKLDTLVDMTGELVIAQSMLKRNSQILSTTDQELYQILNQISQITSILQKTSMSMRMVPIKSTFQKMIRVVRDLAKSSDKEVGLHMAGEETEIDRNMVDELYEPMVHMIRNAIDHGIEMPDDREKTEKDRRGVIELHAYHRGGNIVIEIKDDGSGLDKERIIERARSKNLIEDAGSLTDNEVYNLIFRPGFSTAKEVTDISGRGVGMDVVKKAVDKLKGRVEIASNPGQGSTFTIRLPLTLAIIEGMLCRVGQEKYIVPTLSIIESFLPEKRQYHTIEGKGEMILSRNEVVPLIRIDRIFGVDGGATDPWNGLVVAVEHDGEKKCLLFDEILGKEEVVIKSLGKHLKDTKGVAGGAIMGDGRVGLILDIPGVIEIAENN